jgi:hypothetical protein
LKLAWVVALGFGISCAAHAADPTAARMVDAVSVTRLAKAEVHSKAPADRELASSAGANSDVELGAVLPLIPAQDAPLKNRLELTAGTDGMLVLSDASKQISLFAEARYRLTRVLQLGGTLAYRHQVGGETSDSAFQALIGPTFNFGARSESLGNAFFISPQVGLTTGQTSFNDVTVNSNSQATLALHIGKRFELGKNISYAPSIGMVKEWSFSPSFVIQPIALSVFF